MGPPEDDPDPAELRLPTEAELATAHHDSPETGVAGDAIRDGTRTASQIAPGGTWRIDPFDPDNPGEAGEGAQSPRLQCATSKSDACGCSSRHSSIIPSRIRKRAGFPRAPSLDCDGDGLPQGFPNRGGSTRPTSRRLRSGAVPGCRQSPSGQLEALLASTPNRIAKTHCRLPPESLQATWSSHCPESPFLAL